MEELDGELKELCRFIINMSVMRVGISMMHMYYAVCWASLEHWMQQYDHSMVYHMQLVHYSLMCNAMEQKIPYMIVHLIQIQVVIEQEVLECAV